MSITDLQFLIEMDKILFKRNFEEAIERLTAFYNQQSEDRIFVSFKPPSKSLKEFAKKYANEYVSYPDPYERLEFWSQYMHAFPGGLSPFSH